MMKPRAMLSAMAVLAPFLLPLPAIAATAAPATAAHVKPMHPDTLTLHPRGRPPSRHVSHRATRHPFNPRTPIHNTFVGPRM